MFDDIIMSLIYFIVFIITDEDEEYAHYDSMKRQLSQLLASAINTIHLDTIKMHLTGLYPNINLEIIQNANNVSLMPLLRSCFSVSNVASLKDFLQHCKAKCITQELDDLLNKRDRFYENILAKTFAKKAIEDHEMCKTDSIVS